MMTAAFACRVERSRRRRSLASCAAGVLLTCVASARAADYVVGPAAIGPDFTDLQAAIDAASDGDTLLIDGAIDATGVLIQDKSLRLIGIHGKPEIQSLGVRDLAATRSVALVGLDLKSVIVQFQPLPGLDLRNNAGLVVVQDCSSPNPGSQWSEASIANCSSVVLSRVSFTGGSTRAGIEASNSTVWIHGSTFRGGWGHFNSFTNPPGGPGLDATGSTIHAFGSAFIGGNGDEVYDDSIMAFEGTLGGPGAKLANGTQFFHQFCAIVDGKDGLGAFGTSPPPIVGSGAVTVAGTPVELELASTVSEGASLAITIRAPPQTSVLLLAGFAGAPIQSPAVLGALTLALGPSLVIVPLGSTHPSGELSFNVALPSLAAGDLAASIDLQVLSVPAVKKPALSNHAVLTVLDSSL